MENPVLLVEIKAPSKCIYVFDISTSPSDIKSLLDRGLDIRDIPGFKYAEAKVVRGYSTAVIKFGEVELDRSNIYTMFKYKSLRYLNKLYSKYIWRS